MHRAFPENPGARLHGKTDPQSELCRSKHSRGRRGNRIQQEALIFKAPLRVTIPVTGEETYSCIYGCVNTPALIELND